MVKGKSEKRDESGGFKKDIEKTDKELDRLARGGRGGDNVSEALAAWRDDIDDVEKGKDKK